MRQMNKLREYIEKNPHQTKRLLGMEYSQLIQLIQAAELLDQERRKMRCKSKIRLIKSGGGCRPKLSVEDQLLLTLTYLHQNPTFQMLGIQFEVSESTANDIFHYWLKVLRELLPASLLEQVKKNQDEWEWVEELLSEFELIVGAKHSVSNISLQSISYRPNASPLLRPVKDLYLMKSRRIATQERRKVILLRIN